MKFIGTVQRQFTLDEVEVYRAIYPHASPGWSSNHPDLPARIDQEEIGSAARRALLAAYLDPPERAELSDRIRLAEGDDRKAMLADPVAWYEKRGLA